MSHDFVIDKINIDSYLKALGKTFRKLNGTKTPAEIIIVGGAIHFNQLWFLRYDY